MHALHARGLAAALILALAGCGAVRDSGANPLNWFGRPAAAPSAAVTVAGDPRPLTAITELRVSPSAGGAIVEARGLPPIQGWWGASLVPVPADAGTLAFELRAVPAEAGARAGPPRSRELVVATFVSDARLRGVRRVRVDGSAGALAVAR